MKPNVPANLPPCGLDRSDALHPSSVPATSDFRSRSLDTVRNRAHDHANLEHFIPPPPLISCSDFVPRAIVDLLMSEKKDGALGVKWEKGDSITNMEGALHTFVTPVISRCEIMGDYKFDPARGGHGVDVFGDVLLGPIEEGTRRKYQMARMVVLSASIQMDFEDSKIMVKASALEEAECVGEDLLADDKWVVLSKEEKRDDAKRRAFDDSLRRHMIFHLTKGHRLTSKRSIKSPLSTDATIQLLKSFITSSTSDSNNFVGEFTILGNKQILSLEMLFNTAIQQVTNEFAALEILCPQGYVYTYDPASIFAHRIGAKILNRLMLAALKHLSNNHRFTNMRVFAFNDYADRGVMDLLGWALGKQEHVVVTTKQDLFNGEGRAKGLYDVRHIPQAEGAMLVIHNNSDGFGQNIETEWMSGSLDGAIGSSTSAAASLERGREDLLDFIW